jgi:hypothetical protein
LRGFGLHTQTNTKHHPPTFTCAFSFTSAKTRAPAVFNFLSIITLAPPLEPPTTPPAAPLAVAAAAVLLLSSFFLFSSCSCGAAATAAADPAAAVCVLYRYVN